MVLTPSAMIPLGTKAPDFALPDTEGNTVRRRDFKGQPLLVAFICNHCPYVKHVADKFAQLASQWQDEGIAVVGISSNDVSTHPDDSPEAMAEEAARRGYTFPYLYDESQDVAREYDARCTPDFFLFDSEHELVYRGQMDASRPNSDIPVTGADLQKAIDALRDGDTLATQNPSVGCNIKWKE